MKDVANVKKHNVSVVIFDEGTTAGTPIRGGTRGIPAAEQPPARGQVCHHPIARMDSGTRLSSSFYTDPYVRT